MNCDEVVELVTAYLDGSLPEPERAEFEAHLEECPGCDRYLSQFRWTIELLGELPGDALSSAGRQRLLDAFGELHGRGDPAGDA
jgi:anti-sigma factor RsiW